MEVQEFPTAGPVGPFYDGIDTEYWAALSRGEFVLQRCPDCREWIWAASWRCPSCGCWEQSWEAVEPKGRVYSWIRTHHVFDADMASALPYVTVLAELPAAGNRRVMGILVGDETGLAIGAPVQGVIQPASKLTHGQAVLRWRLIK